MKKKPKGKKADKKKAAEPEEEAPVSSEPVWPTYFS